VPNKYASQLALPALLYISGMISAAVMVGDISAIAIAVTPLNPRQLARNPVSVSLFSITRVLLNDPRSAECPSFSGCPVFLLNVPRSLDDPCFP